MYLLSDLTVTMTDEVAGFANHEFSASLREMKKLLSAY